MSSATPIPCDRERVEFSAQHHDPIMGGSRPGQVSVEKAAASAVLNLSMGGDNWGESSPLLWIPNLDGRDSLIFFTKLFGRQTRLRPRWPLHRAFIGTVDLDPALPLRDLREFIPMSPVGIPASCCLSRGILVGVGENTTRSGKEWYATVHALPLATPLGLPPFRPRFPLGATSWRRDAVGTSEHVLGFGGMFLEGGVPHVLWKDRGRPVGWQTLESDHWPGFALNQLTTAPQLAPGGLLRMSPNYARPFTLFTGITHLDEQIATCRIEPRLLAM